MNVKRTLPALVIAAALPACADGEPAPQFAPVTCELNACVADPDLPIPLARAGVLWLYVSASPGEAYSVRASDPDKLDVVVADGDIDVMGLEPGAVDLELVDDDGDDVDTVELTVIQPDHLAARMRWVEGGEQQVESPVLANAPLTVPANSAVGITVTPLVESFPLAGLIDYEISAELPEGAVLDTTGLSEAILLMRSGEHDVTYRTGALEQRFVIATE